MENWREILNLEYAGNEAWRIAVFFGIVLTFPTQTLFLAGDPQRALAVPGAGPGAAPPAGGA